MKKIVDWKIVDDPREDDCAICFVFLYDDFTWAYSNFSLMDVSTRNDESLERIYYSLYDSENKHGKLDDGKLFHDVFKEFVDEEIENLDEDDEDEEYYEYKLECYSKMLKERVD